MDAFLIAFSNLSVTLLPIIGAACLVCLIILLIKLIGVLKTVDATLIKSHNTIDLVDKSIEKVQAPLDTAVKVSHTVDKAHDATLEAVDKTKDFVVKNADVVKEKVNDFINGKKEEELPQIDPKDVIGG